VQLHCRRKAREELCSHVVYSTQQLLRGCVFWTLSIVCYFKNTTFRNCICCRLQVRVKTSTLLGPSETANLNQWTARAVPCRVRLHLTPGRRREIRSHGVSNELVPMIPSAFGGARCHHPGSTARTSFATSARMFHLSGKRKGSHAQAEYIACDWLLPVRCVTAKY
jgi:hypothetical protein